MVRSVGNDGDGGQTGPGQNKVVSTGVVGITRVVTACCQAWPRQEGLVNDSGQVRALAWTHWSQGIFQSPYPSSGASCVLVPVISTMSPKLKVS